MTGRVLNPFSSLRARIVFFATAMLLVAICALYFINRRLEERSLHHMEEYMEAVTLAVGLAVSSFPSEQYLYETLEQQGEGRLTVAPGGIIRHILVVDEAGKIVDSTDRNDIGTLLQAGISNLPPMSPGDLRGDEGEREQEQERTITWRAETSKGRRTVITVVSMTGLQRVVGEATRDRLVATASLGLLLILLTGAITWRFTRPIDELARAASRVAAGDLDFQVPVGPRDEVGVLSETFNGMLVGLRSKRELEEKLQRAERSAVVGRLASGIAHEIRNPLNFINLSIDHLREKFAPASGEAARAEYTRILGAIKDEIGRLNRMVSDFLSYGRPARLKLHEVSARAILEEVMGLVGTQAEQQHVRLTVWEEVEPEREASDGDSLRADPEQLKTCFSNLTINAIQAMPEGGALEIVIRPRGPEVEVEFSDTGSGIAPEALGQIFEPYYSTKETGIGLGLPLTKKIIEEHGGRIAVRSEPGAGTTFTLTLPREPAGPRRPAPAEQPVLERP